MSNMARKRRDVESGTRAPPSAPRQRPEKLPVVEGGRDDMVWREAAVHTLGLALSMIRKLHNKC
jgi:hypothetical protein